MPLTPSQFIRQQLDAQQLSMKQFVAQFVARSGLGLSHAYQLLNGDRKRVSAETMDAVARGFGMTPAEAAELMGRGSSATDLGELERLAIVRLVSDADWPTAKRILLSLAAANASETGTANHAGHPRNGRGRNSGGADIISATRGLVLARSTAVLAWICRPLHPLGAPTAATA